jgi:AhpD family alkylhydroperoxidase
MIAFAVSNAAGCCYCQAHTANAAQKNNVSSEKIQAIFEFESNDLFSDQEKAALRVALHAGMAPNAVANADSAGSYVVSIENRDLCTYLLSL